MKPCRSLLILLKLIYITLFPAVIEADRVKVSLEVTGYLGHLVTLPCEFIQGPQWDNITQIQWKLLRSEENNETIIIVFNMQFGLSIPESSLKDKFTIKEQSLIIKDVEMRDAGLYTCSIIAFPSGSFQGKTKLVVKEMMPFSSEAISAIVISIILLVVILAAMAYLFFIRHGSSVRHHVDTDTSGLVIYAARQSVIARHEDVVYSDVELKKSREAAPSSGHKNTNCVNDDVTYAEVVVLRQQPQ